MSKSAPTAEPVPRIPGRSYRPVSMEASCAELRVRARNPAQNVRLRIQKHLQRLLQPSRTAFWTGMSARQRHPGDLSRNLNCKGARPNELSMNLFKREIRIDLGSNCIQF